MDFHEILMKGSFKTDNIKSKNKTLVIDIDDSTGKTTLKTDLKIESGSDNYVLISDSNGNCSFSPRTIPAGDIFLFDSDIEIIGYTLLTNVDDAVVYITKGSAASGETGGTDKSGGTWTMPSSHKHTISIVSSHTHSPTDTTLSITQLPSHTHWLLTHEGDEYLNVTLTGSNYIKRLHTTGGGTGGDHSYHLMGYNSSYGTPNGGPSSSTGGGGSHNHGTTGSAGYHDHTTGSSSLNSSWRPYGRTYTRQRKD